MTGRELTRLYRGILNAVRQSGCRCFDRRAPLTGAGRSCILSVFLPEVSMGGDAGEALS